MEVKLICQGGKNAGKEIPVRVPKFFIGRSEECHLRPGNSEVSRRHAVILVEEGSVTVQDFDSSNGTFVNGERVQGERELANGDTLRIGSLEFKIERSVRIGGRKRPKVASVGEAAVRTASSPRVDDDNFDVGQWFNDAPSTTDKGQTSDTQSGPVSASPSNDTSVTKQHRHDQAEQPAEKKPARPSFTPEKPENTQSAASDTLRKLMGERR